MKQRQTGQLNPVPVRPALQIFGDALFSLGVGVSVRVGGFDADTFHVGGGW